jgi:cell division transport system permease protein
MDSKRYITLERIVKNGFINFGRNIWLAIAAIAMMGITLTILLFAIIANATFSHTISDLTDHIDVSVYLKDAVTQSQREKLVAKIEQLDNVQSVSYVSKEEALKKYEKDNANNPLLLNAISQTENPLSAELHIKPKDPNQLDSIKAFLDEPANLALQSDPTSYSGDRKSAIDKITKATHFMQQAGIVGIIVFILISMLIIFNTIRMTIFNRRDELVIMRLLGASPGYIRGPFIVETMLYGAVAAAISLIICGGLFAISSQTLVGIMIGAASSAIATRRYLKLK